MYFFAVTWAILIVGLIAHVTFDRHPDRHTRRRVVELVAVWFVVFGIGVNGVVAALGHLMPGHDSVAAEIGFAPSAFQFEVGVGDLALGVAGLACLRPRFRGSWMSAVVLVAVIQLGGDGVGHLIEWFGRDNTAVNNIWAIPTCFLVPGVAALATIALHRERVRSGGSSQIPVSTHRAAPVEAGASGER